MQILFDIDVFDSGAEFIGAGCACSSYFTSAIQYDSSNYYSISVIQVSYAYIMTSFTSYYADQSLVSIGSYHCLSIKVISSTRVLFIIYHQNVGD